MLCKPSDICTDCGASPQDVRHQFACTRHPTDYGGIRWDQFVSLAISTTETLTDLKTNLVVANNNNKDVKRMFLEEAESFTSDQVTSAINSCRNNRACGPYTLSIFHLKNLGPLATEHLTSLYNDTFKSCRSGRPH